MGKQKNYSDGGIVVPDVEKTDTVIKNVCEREENRVVIVTHGGVIRSVCAAI